LNLLQRKDITNDSRIDQILRQRRSFSEKRYDEITQLAVGRSLKVENDTAFALLDNDYNTRNSLVHSGQLKYHDRTASQEIVVTRSIINDFFRGCETAIDWIEAM
jgi:hypothetical protein